MRATALGLLLLLLGLAGAGTAAPRRGDVPTRVYRELAARRKATGLLPLDRRKELDGVARDVAREVAARSPSQRFAQRTSMEQRLRDAGVRGVRRANRHVQVLGGYPDLAKQAVTMWEEYRQAWERVLDPAMEAVGIGAAWTGEGSLVLVSILVEDETQLADLEALERHVLEKVNLLRAKRGLRELIASERLAALAREHSEDMARRGYFAHETPDGHGISERLAPRVGPATSVSENIARNRGTGDAAATAVTSWEESPGHRASMLKVSFNETGVGVAADDEGTFYFTQVFVERPPASPAPAAATRNTAPEE